MTPWARDGLRGLPGTERRTTSSVARTGCRSGRPRPRKSARTDAPVWTHRARIRPGVLRAHRRSGVDRPSADPTRGLARAQSSGVNRTPDAGRADDRERPMPASLSAVRAAVSATDEGYPRRAS